MVLADAKVLIDVLKAADEWLQQVVQRAKRRRDRAAAQVLHDAFVVVAAMRAYDNAFRPLLGQLLTFSVEWSPDQRRRLSEELNAFFDIEQVLPPFRQALRGLESASLDGAGAEPVERVMAAATTFSEEIAGSIRLEKENYVSRRAISDALLYGRSHEDEATVRQWAETLVQTLDRPLLAGADNAFGRVRQEILAAHDLPDPGFAVALS